MYGSNKAIRSVDVKVLRIETLNPGKEEQVEETEIQCLQMYDGDTSMVVRESSLCTINSVFGEKVRQIDESSMHSSYSQASPYVHTLPLYVVLPWHTVCVSVQSELWSVRYELVLMVGFLDGETVTESVPVELCRSEGRRSECWTSL